MYYKDKCEQQDYKIRLKPTCGLKLFIYGPYIDESTDFANLLLWPTEYKVLNSHQGCTGGLETKQLHRKIPMQESDRGDGTA